MAVKPNGATPDKRRKYDESFMAEALRRAQTVPSPLRDLSCTPTRAISTSLPACKTCWCDPARYKA